MAICLTDGFRLPDCRVEHQAVVDGDARSAAIAAASVIAKVTRDRYMRRAAELYPGWNFGGQRRLLDPEHREAIVELGISPLHRLSFASIAYTQLDLGARAAAEAARRRPRSARGVSPSATDGDSGHVEGSGEARGKRRPLGELPAASRRMRRCLSGPTAKTGRSGPSEAPSRPAFTSTKTRTAAVEGG